jgi:hypothetical protein
VAIHHARRPGGYRGSSERLFYNFQENQTYFWQRRGGAIASTAHQGRRRRRATVYNIGKNFKGRSYIRQPHVIYLGSPIGRSGETCVG